MSVCLSVRPFRYSIETVERTVIVTSQTWISRVSIHVACWRAKKIIQK